MALSVEMPTTFRTLFIFLQRVVIVAGGHTTSDGVETELLYLGSNEWQPGPVLVKGDGHRPILQKFTFTKNSP